MVAIVSGGTPGLNLGSREVLGSAGVVGNASEGRNGQGVYVNAATGNLVVQVQDELIAARGLDASSLRTYNSSGSFNDDNGDNWSSNVVSLRLAGVVNTFGSSIQRTDRDGSTATYTFDVARALYVTAEGGGAFDTIAYVAADSQFQWTDGATGITERYEGGGAMRLVSSRDRAGNAISYAYGAGGFLSSVTTASGDAIFYDYTGTNLAQVRTVAGGVTTTRVRYGYDASNRLASVTVDLTPSDNSIADGKVYTTSYTYDGASKRLSTITQSDGNAFTFTYVDLGGGDFRIASARDALGQTSTFSYGAGSMTVTDPLGLTTRYESTNGFLTRITAPAVSGQSASRLFGYDAAGNVTSVTDGENRTVSFGYDAAGNQVLQRDALGDTVRRTFDARNQLLTETLYAQADPDGAGPADAGLPLTTRYLYDAGGRNQLRFTVSAEGGVTEHRYDAFGQRVSSITYTGGTYAVAGLAPDAALTEAQLSAWAGAQSLAATQRVDMAYDGRGQLQTRTSYAKVTPAGDGVADGTQSIERLVYDQFGQLVQSTSANGGVTQYGYDGLGRVITTANALGQMVVTQYDDVGRKTAVTLASGLVTSSAYDAAGRLVTVTQSDTAGVVLGATRYSYDADNRLRMTQDPTGVRQWVLYDEAGRKTADIDGNGTMTEYSYDRSDRLVRTMRWGTAVNTALLVDASGLPVTSANAGTVRPAASAADGASWLQYDGAGRLVRQAEQLDANRAAVTETRYDAASRVVQVLRYANAVPVTGAAAVAAGAVPLPAGNADDRVTRNFYDAESRLAGTLDGEGSLAAFRYDASGQQVERIRYATPTNAALRAAGSLAQLVPTDAAGDVHELMFYDAEGRVVAQLDGEKYLTEFVRDAEGNVTRTYRYANAVTAAVTTASQVGTFRPQASPLDRVSSRAYDALGRLKQETSPEGVVTQYAYDAVGNLLSTVRAVGTAEVRSLLVRYDLQNRVVAELSAEGAALLSGGQTQAQVDAIWATHSTWYAYDAASRRISSTDALGQRTLYFYDVDGALTHTVDALGEVRETRYDARGRAVEQLAYAGRINTAGLTGGLAGQVAALVAGIANASLDSRSVTSYTADSRAATDWDPVGSATIHVYNAFGEEAARTFAGTSVNVSTQYAYDRRGLLKATNRDAGGLNIFTTTEYDAFGRGVRTSDARGNWRVQAYDRLGRMVCTRDPLNAQRSTSYDAFDRVLQQVDALGNRTSYAYDDAARTMRVTTPEGIATTTAYTRFGQVLSITDGKGQVTRYSYDHDGRLTRTDTPLTTSSSSYDAAGRLVDTVDANGTHVAYTYDAANRTLARTVDPAGLKLTTRWAYDAKGQCVSTTDANGIVTATEFDRNGQVLKQTVDPTGLALRTTYQYDAAGHTLSVTSPAGAVTQYQYDGMGRRVLEWTDPGGLNLVRRWSYDGNGNVVSATDAAGAVTRYAYDIADRLVYTVDPTGAVLANAYDAQGRVVRTTAYTTRINPGALGAAPQTGDIAPLLAASSTDAIEHRVFDKDGRLAATVDGTGAVVKYAYDANGNVLTRTAFALPISLAAWQPGTVPLPSADPAHDEFLQTTFDALNRATCTIDGTGALVTRAYDGNGNLVREVAYALPMPPTTEPSGLVPGANDRVTSFAYDAANRRVLQVNALGAVTEQAFDGDGHVVRRTEYANAIGAVPALGTPGSAAAIRSLVVADAPNDRTTRFGYDNAGRLAVTVDAVGASTENLHDAAGRVLAVIARATQTNPDVIQAPTLANLRNAIGPITASDRITNYAYDAAGRLIYTVGPACNATFNQYDGAGRLTRTTRYAGIVQVSTGTTAADIARAVQAVANAATDRTESSTYDAAGHLLTSTDTLGATESYQYDGIGRKTSFTNRKGAVWTYGYDAAGRLVTETSPQVAITTARSDSQNLWLEPSTAAIVTRLAYDALGRLTQRTEAAGRAEERTTSYEYDGAGHQVRVIYPPVDVYDPATDLTTFSKQLESRTWYDAFGNAVASKDTAGALSQKTYDRLGRLTYDVDALGYVTLYKRNAFGDVVLSRRYAGPTALVVPNFTQASQAVSTAWVDYVVTLPGVCTASDRTLSMTYDCAGRVLETKQAAVYFYDSSAAAGSQRGIAEAKTVTSYDAFGQVKQTSVLRNGQTNQFVTTTHYYDTAGREIATVDALGYVTRHTFDPSGNLVEVEEYALPTTAWSASGFSWPPGHQDDRLTRYGYDALGRRTSETRVNVEYSTASDGTSVRGDVVRYFEYDALGNLTVTREPDGNAVTTYDALGRAIAIAAPARPDANGASLVPLTVLNYDAVGNLVEKVEYAKGAGANPSSPIATAGDDRHTTTWYDRGGRGVLVKDAEGQVEYRAYDAGGRLAKKWQDVTANDESVHTVYEIDRYDALGHLVETRTPATTAQYSEATGLTRLTDAQAGSVSVAMQYNAFGEVSRKGGTTGLQEYFAYDAAGRLWHTNSGDGVDRILLYDLQGNTTAEIRSGGSIDMWDFFSSPQVADDSVYSQYTRRTDFVVDLLGRVTSKTDAARVDRQEPLYFQRVGTNLKINSSQSLTWTDGVPQSSTGNSVDLGWDDLGVFGSGEIKVHIEYFTNRYVSTGAVVSAGALQTFDSTVFNGDLAAKGVRLTWTDKLPSTAITWADAGIDSITRIVVYKKDGIGTWQPIIDQAPGFGQNIISVAAPIDKLPMTLEWRAVGSTTWTSPTLYNYGDRFVADARQLASGSYEYRATVYPPDGARLIDSGNFTVAPRQLGVIPRSFGFGQSGTASSALGWGTAGPFWNQAFRYRLAGSTGGWSSLAVQPGSSTDSVDMTNVPAGNYQFELLWTLKGSLQPTANETGTFTTAGTTSRQYWLTSINTDPVAGSISTQYDTVMTCTASWTRPDRNDRPVTYRKVDRWGNVTEMSDPRNAGWKTTYRYNANNQVVEQVQPDSSGNSTARSTISYDRSGRQLAVKDANGHVSGQVYDPGGNLVRELHADGGVVQHAYDAFGQKVRTIDDESFVAADGSLQSDVRTVTFGYDRLGRLLSMNKGSAGVYSFDTNWNMVSSGSMDLVEHWTYDALGRQLSHTNAAGESVYYTYDRRGNVLETIQQGLAERSAYDAQDHKSAEVDRNGKASTWTYDGRGLLASHKDIGGSVHLYTYDYARELTTESTPTTTHGQGKYIGYTYDGAGQVTRIVDYTTGEVTDYSYDLAGRHLRERICVNGTATYQDNHLAYDGAGRLRDVADGRVHIQLDYDAVGNRSHIATTVGYLGKAGEVYSFADKYFRYDEMNRATLVDGDATGNITPTQGHLVAYFHNGNRRSDTFWGNKVKTTQGFDGVNVYSTTTGWATEEYRYDSLNRLTKVVRDGSELDTRYYDAADRLVQSGPATDMNLQYVNALNAGVAPSQAIGTELRRNRYDAFGRLLHEKLLNADYSFKAELSWEKQQFQSKFGGNPYSMGGYDDAGNQLGYTVRTQQGTDAYVAGRPIPDLNAPPFELYEGYQQANTYADSTWRANIGSTIQQYDANGFLVAFYDGAQPLNNRKFVNDSSGRVIFTQQGNYVERQLIANGEVLGTYGVTVDPLNPPADPASAPNFANNSDFNFYFSRIAGGYPAPTPGNYQVHTGDTLQVIAQKAYGDSSLWYRIAEANGLDSNGDMRVGQTLTIPNRVAAVSNNDSTFKPYDPSRMEGDLTPTMRLPPPPKKKSSWFGMLLMVVVAVVVTICSAGALTGATTSFAQAFSAGLNVVAGGSTAAAAGALAGGAAAGSVASQVVGLATGAVDKFDWKSVALSALSAGISAQVPSSLFSSPVASAAARAVIGSTLTQGIGVALGLQQSFDWRGVAAGGLGAAVGAGIGGELGLYDKSTRSAMGPWELFGKSALNGLASGLTAAVARGGRVVVQQVAVDAFGNALGESFARGPTGTPGSNDVGPWSNRDYVNGLDLQSDEAYEARRSEEWIAQSDAVQSSRLYEITAANAQDNFRATEWRYRQELETARQVNGLDLPTDYRFPQQKVLSDADLARAHTQILHGESTMARLAAPQVESVGGAGAGRGFVNPADAVLHNRTPFAGRSTVTDPQAYAGPARLNGLDAARASVGMEKELQSLMRTQPNSSAGWAARRSALDELSERYQMTMRSGGLEPDVNLVTTIGFQQSIAEYELNGNKAQLLGAAGASGVILGMQVGPLPSTLSTWKGAGSIGAPSIAATVRQNNSIGNSFDEYVAASKLRGLDERGLLARQEHLPTPDIAGKNYVKPDYTIRNHDGNVAAYADAKTGSTIPFDAQARGLVTWSRETQTKTLIYYTPDGTTPISPTLLNYARQQGVRIKQVGVQ